MARNSSENPPRQHASAGSIVEPEVQEARSAYYERRKSALRSEIAALEKAAKRDSSGEGLVLAKEQELRDLEVKEHEGMARAEAKSEADGKARAEQERRQSIESQIASADDENFKANFEFGALQEQRNELDRARDALGEDLEKEQAKAHTSRSEQMRLRNELRRKTMPKSERDMSSSQETSPKEPPQKESAVNTVQTNELEAPEAEHAPEPENLETKLLTHMPGNAAESADLTHSELKAELHGSVIAIESLSTEQESDASAHEHLSSSPSRTKAARQKLEAQENNKNHAQEEYFASLKEYQRTRSNMSRVSEELIGERTVPEEVTAKRREWVRARAEFARAQIATVDARLEARTREDVLNKLHNRKSRYSPEQIKEWLTRRSVVLGAEEAEQQVRIEGLGERDKTTLNTLFEKYKQLPPGIRIMGTSAVIVGGVAALSGTGLGLAALAMGGSSAGLRWLAEAKKSTNPAVSSVVGILSRITSIAGVAGLAGEYLVRGGHKWKGSEKKASELLGRKRNFGDLGDEEYLEVLSQERKSAVNVKGTIARHSRWGRVLGSLIGGGALGYGLHEYANAGSGQDPSPVQDAHTPKPEASPTTAPSSEELNVNGQKAVEPVPATKGSSTESLKIEGSTNNADRLLGRFRDQLHEKYLDGKDLPPALKTFYESGKSQDELTNILGFQDSKDGLSARMHEGDSISFENDELVFRKADGRYQTIIDSDGHLNKMDIDKLNPTSARMAGPENVTENTSHIKSQNDVINKVVPTPEEAGSQAVAESVKHPATEDPHSSKASESELTEQPPASIEPTVNSAENTLRADEKLSIESEGSAAAIQAESTFAKPSEQTATVNGLLSMEEWNSRYGDSAPAENLFTNVHNVQVSMTETAPYTWELPNTDQRLPVAFGGTEQVASALAKDYVLSHPNSSMIFISSKTDVFGVVTRYVSQWSSDASGEATLTTEVLKQNGTQMEIPEPKDFISTITR